jgi:CheY-like chemotaxis protein
VLGDSERLLNAPPLSSSQIILVTVEDTGIGLSDEAKITLFHTTEQVRNSGGTGLGLYSLAKRIEALGGKYGVQNRPDGQQGSLFWFTFPYRPDNTAIMHLEMPIETPIVMPIGAPIVTLIETPTTKTPAETPTVTPAKSPPVATLTTSSRRHSTLRQTTVTVVPPLRILLVDDSSAILKITSRFLKINGHTVETADNGLQCLERLKTGRRDFDVLISDLQMPVMDGFTSVREYRAWEEGFMRLSGEGEGDEKRRLHIIGMSANSDEESVKDALAAGMDDFVMKPFNYEILAASLKGAL